MEKDISQRQLLEFIDKQLKARSWNDTQLAQKANISPSVLSKARSGYQPLGWEVCLAIAKAFNVDPISVLIMAGHLPNMERPKWSPEREQWNMVFDQLPVDEREELLKFAYIKLEKYKKT